MSSPTREEFEAIADEAWAKAKEQIDPQVGYGPPRLIMYGPQGLSDVVIVGSARRAEVQALIRVTQARAFVLICESWMVRRSATDAPDDFSTAPDRIDTLTMFAVSRAWAAIYTVHIANRDDGRLVADPTSDRKVASPDARGLWVEMARQLAE